MNTMDDVELLHVFHQCAHKLHMNERYKGQSRLLVQLLEKGTLTQRELIDITGLRSATLSEQLENLEKAEFIIRSKNLQDRRNVDITLTASGKDVAKELKQNHEEKAHALFSDLSEEEKQELFQLLQKLYASCKQKHKEKEVMQKCD